MKRFFKPLALVFAIFFGYFLSEISYQLAKYAAPCLFATLLLSMMKVDKVFEKKYIKPMIVVAVVPLLLGLMFYISLTHFFEKSSPALVSSALIILSPLATTAVVMVHALAGNVAFTMVTVILSHFITIILWPAFVLAAGIKVRFFGITSKIILMIMTPFICSRIIRKTRFSKTFQDLSFLSFYIWVFIVFTNIASISHTFKSGELKSDQLFTMFCISLGIFLINYASGLYVSRKSEFKTEMLQLFIQRNTVFGIWLANSFFSPLYAICPIFYLIFQNVYNTTRLVLAHRYETDK